MLVLLILTSMGGSAWAAEGDDLKEMLARAEALYYQADFPKSVELLLRADELIQQQTGNTSQKIDVKLQLTLGFIGLNDTARAKEYLRQVYALDPDHVIDPHIFPPKVIRLAEDTRAEHNQGLCQSATDEAQRELRNGNGDAVLKLIRSNQGKCSGLALLNSKAADLFFQEGLEAYKKSQMDAALQKFRAALSAEPKHDLAKAYLDLAESKLEVAAERYQNIRTTLDRYKTAYEQKDLAAMRTVFPNMGAEEKAARDNFQIARTIQISFTISDIQLSGETATVPGLWQLNIRTTVDNRAIQSPQSSIVVNLRNRTGSWVIESITH
jgi:hypothetical protein